MLNLCLLNIHTGNHVPPTFCLRPKFQSHIPNKTNQVTQDQPDPHICASEKQTFVTVRLLFCLLCVKCVADLRKVRKAFFPTLAWPITRFIFVGESFDEERILKICRFTAKPLPQMACFFIGVMSSRACLTKAAPTDANSERDMPSNEASSGGCANTTGGNAAKSTKERSSPQQDTSVPSAPRLRTALHLLPRYLLIQICFSSTDNTVQPCQLAMVYPRPSCSATLFECLFLGLRAEGSGLRAQGVRRGARGFDFRA